MVLEMVLWYEQYPCRPQVAGSLLCYQWFTICPGFEGSARERSPSLPRLETFMSTYKFMCCSMCVVRPTLPLVCCLQLMDMFVEQTHEVRHEWRSNEKPMR